MDIRLLKRYRKSARKEYSIEKETPLYPRAAYQFTHDKECLEHDTIYYVKKGSDRVWDYSNRKSPSPKKFLNIEDAMKYIEREVRFKVQCLATAEKLKRAGCKKCETIKPY